MCASTQSTAPEADGRALAVAVGVLEDARGRWLLARRPDGRPHAGQWEFPGGKLHPGEDGQAALARELAEELGIEVTAARRLTRCRFRYPEGTVDLDVWRVRRWRGDPRPREGQALRWVRAAEAAALPLLAANRHILRALDLPPLYAVTGRCSPDAPGAWLERLERCLAAGARLVYLRDRLPEGPARARLVRAAVALAEPHGARVLAGATPAQALAWGAHGVHLSAAAARDIARREGTARRDGLLVAVSCHDPDELEVAERIGADFAVLSPVCPTRSHPGAEPLGWERWGRLAGATALPVYALGGLGPSALPAAWEAGAVGVAMLGALWEAADPRAVVARCLALDRDWTDRARASV